MYKIKITDEIFNKKTPYFKIIIENIPNIGMMTIFTYKLLTEDLKVLNEYITSLFLLNKKIENKSFDIEFPNVVTNVSNNSQRIPYGYLLENKEIIPFDFNGTGWKISFSKLKIKKIIFYNGNGQGQLVDFTPISKIIADF